MVSIQITIGRTTIVVMFIIFIVLLVFPAIAVALARFAVHKRDELSGW